MMFKKKNSFLLSVILALICIECKAQCVTPPSCEDMGYTQSASDCTTDKIVKCPFDISKVFCLNGNEETIISYDCSTTQLRLNYIGLLFFSDGRCSNSTNYKGGRLLGVVVKGSNNIVWGGDVNEILNYNDAKMFCRLQGGELVKVGQLLTLNDSNVAYERSSKSYYPLLSGPCYRTTVSNTCSIWTGSMVSNQQTSATSKLPFYCIARWNGKELSVDLSDTGFIVLKDKTIVSHFNQANTINPPIGILSGTSVVWGGLNISSYLDAVNYCSIKGGTVATSSDIMPLYAFHASAPTYISSYEYIGPEISYTPPVTGKEYFDGGTSCFKISENGIEITNCSTNAITYCRKNL